MIARNQSHNSNHAVLFQGFAGINIAAKTINEVLHRNLNTTRKNNYFGSYLTGNDADLAQVDLNDLKKIKLIN